jgi:hypothetical protein
MELEQRATVFIRTKGSFYHLASCRMLLNLPINDPDRYYGVEFRVIDKRKYHPCPLCIDKNSEG